MKRVIKLTESDLKQIVEKVLNEQGNMFGTAGVGYSPSPFSDVTKLPRRGKENINPKNLKVGDGGKYNPKKSADVKILQQKLMDLGLLKTDSMVPTGYFGSLTQKALDAYNSGSTAVKDVAKKAVKDKKTSTSDAAKTTAKCETGTEKVLIPGASLLFDGDELIWMADGKKIKSWDAESGLTFFNTPPGDYDKLVNRFIQNREEWAKQKNAGPLPEGQYNVGPLETRSGTPEEIGFWETLWLKAIGNVEADTEANKQFCKNTNISRISWGNYRLAITPTGNQPMYQRGSFYVHGGSMPGSHGCIDLTSEMDDFAKFFGVWSAANGKKTIPLTVRYNNPLLNRAISKLTKNF